MKDCYVNSFRNLVKQTSEETGYTVPEPMETYIVMLLSMYMERTNFLPDRSFIESFLKIQRTASSAAKDLGDTCLFLTGVFPLYGIKYGLDRSYYTGIGIESYKIVSERLNDDLFKMLSNHFEYLQKFIELTTTPAKLYNYGICR